MPAFHEALPDYSLTDDEIVRRVQTGELDVYETLIRRHNQSLYRAARAILNDEAEAEDVKQETSSPARRLRAAKTELLAGALAFCGVSFRCEILEHFKERGRLPNEESHRRQEIHYAHSNSIGLCRPNDRARRETSAKEWAGLGHDQIGLKGFAAKGRRV